MIYKLRTEAKIDLAFDETISDIYMITDDISVLVIQISFPTSMGSTRIETSLCTNKELELEELQTMAGTFDKMLIDADDSVREGMISIGWLAFMKRLLPESEYLRIYYHVFARQIGAIFESVVRGEHEALGVSAKVYPSETVNSCPKSETFFTIVLV